MSRVFTLLFSISVITGLIVSSVYHDTAFAQIANTSGASSADTLRSLIDSKNEELKKIQAERDVVEKNINDISETKNSLLKDIKTIDYNVNQLNLAIKSNKVTLEKLDLEIESLGDQLDQSEVLIRHKRETVAKLLVAMQERDHDSIFHILLKNQSLAASISEVQSISILNQNLVEGVTELKNLQTELAQTLKTQEGKKYSREAEQTTLINRQYIVQDQKAEKKRLLDATQDKEKVYQQQIAELDEKQQEISDTIEQFENQLRASFDPSVLPLKRPGVLGFPVLTPYFTQAYGATKFAARAYRSKFHNGVDFSAPVGTPVLASFKGTVVAVDNNDRGTSRWNKYQYGKYIVIQHDNNLSTLYAHLSRQTVRKGDVVEAGTIIGYSGNTGYSVGAHLHLTVFWAPSVQYKSIPPAAGLVPLGITIDPRDYLPRI